MTPSWINTTKEVSKKYVSSVETEYQKEDTIVIHVEFASPSMIITAHGSIIVWERVI